MSSEDYEENTMFYDNWSEIYYNGKHFPDVELSFVTKSHNDYYSFGLPNTKSDNDFIPSVYGIKQMEEIQQGEIRKVNIECRIPYTTNQLRSVDGIEYRLYVLEGINEYTVIDWQKVERGYNENYLLINTNELIPGRYYLDFKIRNDLEIIHHPKKLQFDIVNNMS